MGAAAEPDPSVTPSPLDLRDLCAVSVLGRGAKGVVFLVRPSKRPPTEDGDHRHLALKAISRRFLRGEGQGKDNHSSPPPADGECRRIRFEREVLASLNHPLLPSLRGVVSTDEIVGFAIDRCTGGTLDALRKRQTERMFSEDAIRFYAAELVLALEHLHGLGIVYRDLKPDNVLIQGDGHIMLVDFDLSTRLAITTPSLSASAPPSAPLASSPSSSSLPSPSPPHAAWQRRRRGFLQSWLSCARRPSYALNDPSTTTTTTSSSSSTSSPSTTTSYSSAGKSNSFVGTEEYVAPEVIRGTGHDFAVDWWGLGVVLYEMLYGRTPFRGQNRKETFYHVLSKEPDLAGEKSALRDLIGRLLVKDPDNRLGLRDIKRHDFFTGVDWESVLTIARPPFIPVVEDDVGHRVRELEEDQGIDVESFVRGVFFPDKDNDGNKIDEMAPASTGQQDAAGKETANNNLPPEIHNTWVRALLPKPSRDDHFSAF